MDILSCIHTPFAIAMPMRARVARRVNFMIAEA